MYIYIVWLDLCWKAIDPSRLICYCSGINWLELKIVFHSEKLWLKFSCLLLKYSKNNIWALDLLKWFPGMMGGSSGVMTADTSHLQMLQKACFSPALELFPSLLNLSLSCSGWTSSTPGDLQLCLQSVILSWFKRVLMGKWESLVVVIGGVW